jgi:hypothetical protein
MAHVRLRSVVAGAGRAILLGYYVTYAAGVRWRLKRRDKT